MKLRVSQQLDNNSVRLDYIETPGKPSRMPSYIINKVQADEFVKKYNRKSDGTVKIATLSTMAGCISGVGAALKKHTNKFIGPFWGALTGFIASIIFVRYDRNKLMNEYNVIEI